MSAETHPLVQQVREGKNRQLVLLAARGLLPLPPGEILPVQVDLALHRDPEISRLAQDSLAEAELAFLLPYLQGDAPERVLRFFGRHSQKPEVLETVLRRRAVPGDLLEDMARRLPGPLQEILLLRQDAIVARPTILEALERNPELTSFTRRRIDEYRAHLVGEEAPAPMAGSDGVPEEPREAEEASDAEVYAALNEARATPVDGEIEETTGLAESQIRLLPVPVRLKLARSAPSRGLRTLLLRDSNSKVALAVLDSNPLSDQEIEQIAKSRNVVSDVLERIAADRRWSGRYNIVLSLVGNPRTPVGIANRLLPRIAVRDLRALSKDFNVPEAIRSASRRLYRIKAQ